MGWIVLVIIAVVVLFFVSASKPNKEEEARKCFYRGCTYIQQNKDYDRDLAINYFTQAIQLNPNHGDAYLFRAGEYKEKGDYDKAIADYNEMVRIAPEIYIYERGCLYEEIGDFRKAIADFEETLRFNPNHVGAINSLKEARQKFASAGV